ncbi:helix-turn-helix transcriptional regulator [Legionella shakespearei]|uniref:Putative HTH-type transcriptional regulator n=1 Tax=Legionella shakespearei DSM 23087 TaxID=1122169 RepID=A0A0W0YH25_9GAMM|nr:helix-turn-helix transcriptional regulator [Legionella shakespearei]KTD56213.1 putative HTH-type transcriptional regulator [Legionella shakespearei DSM 23087]
MSNIILQENHYSAQIIKDVSELALPLKRYGIEHFCHVRYFIDGSISVLISNKNLYQHHLKCGYKVGPTFPFTFEELRQQKYHFLVYEDVEESFSYALNDYKNLFGLDNFVYLVNSNKNYVDYFVFASALYNKQIINFYLNQRDILDQFVFDFKNKANKLITQGECNKIILPENMRLRLGSVNNEAIKLNDFQAEASKIKHQVINYLGKSIKFTRREMDCLHLLKSGYTAKEVAIHFGLSPRTIENHINNIKFKFGLNRKPDIIKAFIKCSRQQA